MQSDCQNKSNGNVCLRKLDMLTFFLRCVYRLVSLSLNKIVLAAPVKGVKDLSTAPQDLQFQSDEHLKFCLRGERIPLQKTSAK